jgi:predicted DNA binding CopG/RHH family protein
MKAKKVTKNQLEKDYVQGLNQEEVEILQELESRQYKAVSEEKQSSFKAIVKDNIAKRKAVSIKPLEADIIKIKAKAMAKGIPYQTLITSVIHQFANDKLVES